MQFLDCSEIQTNSIAKNIAQSISSLTDNKAIIYLYGDLGAGKTTFARSFINFFGFEKVKSPTYSIVEPYENTMRIYHFDLYRLCDIEELEMIGMREYFDNICLIEWADNFLEYLPTSDIDVKISGNTRRDIIITANTNTGEMILNSL